MSTLLLSVGATTLDLNASLANGFYVIEVDIGGPVVRESTEDQPTQDGVTDRTMFFGQRAVSIKGVAISTLTRSRLKAVESLRPFLAPQARPILTYAFGNDMGLRTLGLRVAQWTEPITQPMSLEFMVGWTAEPVAHSAMLNEIAAAVELPGGGRAYDLAFNRTYPPGGQPGHIHFEAGGTYPTWPVYRLFGPATNPAIITHDPDTGAEVAKVAFVNFTVNAGDYLEIDTQKRTVLLNGDPAASRYSFVDFPNTTWRQLQPGMNTLRYSSSSASAPATAFVRWFDAFI